MLLCIDPDLRCKIRLFRSPRLNFGSKEDYKPTKQKKIQKKRWNLFLTPQDSRSQLFRRSAASCFVACWSVATKADPWRILGYF